MDSVSDDHCEQATVPRIGCVNSPYYYKGYKYTLHNMMSSKDGVSNYGWAILVYILMCAKTILLATLSSMSKLK
ncbi:hypothetical protein PHMEG_0007111 [Phytophthora megakarya]|uniref:Uncharacterized protein n=1 Tax=Phytophthora megakarya TaxID=4795 RepID=A0A225WM54_9STRA|nr:hypothetical protein PHMEG_0007111 [Phytophthora megakarya]